MEGLRQKVVRQTIWSMHTEGYVLARLCGLFGWSRQGVYQARKRQCLRAQQLDTLTPLVLQVRRNMPRIGGRKLYYLLKPEFERRGIKLGRDGFFNYLRAQKLLVRPHQELYQNHR